MEKIVRTMMDLIASEACCRKSDMSDCALGDEETEKLYELSKFHDLAHLVGNALIKNNLIKNDALKAKFQKQVMLAFFRTEKTNYELNRLRNALNDAKIPFIVLKGPNIREYYPEPWMRTSCDIDILVHEEQVDAAAKMIAEELGYTQEKKNYHDISMMSGNSVHLELHFNIKEDLDNIDVLLVNCWDYADVKSGYEYCFGNAFFIFHQFAHASYHFLNGGCGVRTILDIYLLEEKCRFDRSVLDDMLGKTEIKAFADAVSLLAGVWFGDGEHDGKTRRMERFVLSGGTFGNKENAIAVDQQNEKGRIGYIFSRIWMRYELLCSVYPELSGRRYLQPYYEAKRWLKVFKPEVRERKKRDLEIIKHMGKETKDEVNRMLSELGLL